MASSVEIPGVAMVLQALAALTPTLTAAAQAALLHEGNQIMVVSQRLVPIDTGLLRSTGAVRPGESPQPHEVVVELSYGGNGLAPYAAAVHERTDTVHPHGQHHFLSEPLYAATEGMADRLAAAIRQALGG